MRFIRNVTLRVSLCLPALALQPGLSAQVREDVTLSIDARHLETETRTTVDPAVLSRAIRTSATKDRILVDTSLLRESRDTQISAFNTAGIQLDTDRSGNELSVPAKAGEWVVLKPVRQAPVAMTKGIAWLPGVGVRADDADGDNFLTYVNYSIVPVVWNLEKNAYELIAHIGVALDKERIRTGDLGRKAMVRLSFDGIPTESEDVFIDRYGIDGEKEVRFLFKEATKPTPRFIVRSDIAQEQSYLLPLSPRIALSSDDASILALGLSETTVRARPVDAMGRVLPEYAGKEVDLKTSGGIALANEKLEFDENALATFRIRAKTLGTIHLEAVTRTPEQMIAGSLSVGTAFPWAQAAAVLLGGAIGGICRILFKKAPKEKWILYACSGSIAALVIYPAAVIGINVTTLSPYLISILPGAFVLSWAVGYGGARAPDMLFSLVLPKPGSRSGAA